MRNYILVLSLFFFGFLQAQELKCTVNFNTEQVAATNQQVFKTLQKSLTEFLNNTKWSDKTYRGIEKIECSFFFNILTFDNVNQFTGTLQVQASRPIYNSTYNSPILNINDKDISFVYNEFQSLNYDPNNFDNNLVSILAFYANLIVGVDADTFSSEGGTKSLETASNIVVQAQQSQDKGWLSTGNQNRFYLVNDMLSPAYSAFRKAMFEYHFEALDRMSDDQRKGKEGVKKALKTLLEIANVRPNAYLTRIFFDAKTDEIVSIFTDGPKVDVTDLLITLNKLSPTNTSKWSQISY
ncbi:type IX secretion system protein PorD [Flavobacterium luminosum]|uniref:DUF4835 family protein n=1 Tax=Flavobacterium luminosum TaxID=2949086 RepID=A0ABT0TM17_9FLAO|nr:DUF4835 family protein [Flavobacterium sp. HXWNR70]MCL9808535.1 DUF4835 family protein [Flavobacterium sp. HXWNR70]